MDGLLELAPRLEGRKGFSVHCGVDLACFGVGRGRASSWY